LFVESLGAASDSRAGAGFGARVPKSGSSGSNTYLRASAGLIGSIVSDSGATYTPGVSERRGTTSTFYHADIKNSVEQTSTSSQSVVASKQYDAFGNEVSSQGPWQGPFQYGGAYGYHTDSDYGLKHLGARNYDSTTGRFLSRDPIKDGRNWYVYCDGNPVALVDPQGLGWVRIALVIGGGLVEARVSGGNPAGAALGAAIGGALASSLEQYTDSGRVDIGRAAKDGLIDGALSYAGGRLITAAVAKAFPLDDIGEGMVRVVHYTTPRAAEQIAKEGFKSGTAYGWPKDVPAIVNLVLGSGVKRGGRVVVGVPADQTSRTMFGAVVFRTERGIIIGAQ
jgi:RHS repeat-associated protein